MFVIAPHVIKCICKLGVIKIVLYCMYVSVAELNTTSGVSRLIHPAAVSIASAFMNAQLVYKLLSDCILRAPFKDIIKELKDKIKDKKHKPC